MIKLNGTLQSCQYAQGQTSYILNINGVIGAKCSSHNGGHNLLNMRVLCLTFWY